MRTYLILKEKARQFSADAEIQALLAEIRGDDEAGVSRGPYTPRSRATAEGPILRSAGAGRAPAALRAARSARRRSAPRRPVSPPSPRRGRLYLGLDSSTQSLTAIVIEVDGTDARVVFDASLSFDETFPQYGTGHGVLADFRSARRTSPWPAVLSVMWADALEVMLARVAASGLDVSRLAAIAGSAQQHGSVYLNADAARLLSRLDPAQPLASQIAPHPVASRSRPSGWTRAPAPSARRSRPPSAAAERSHEHTGSRAFERFTAPQIRKFAAVASRGYAATTASISSARFWRHC